MPRVALRAAQTVSRVQETERAMSVMLTALTVVFSSHDRGRRAVKPVARFNAARCVRHRTSALVR